MQLNATKLNESQWGSRKLKEIQRSSVRRGAGSFHYSALPVPCQEGFPTFWKLGSTISICFGCPSLKINEIQWTSMNFEWNPCNYIGLYWVVLIILSGSELLSCVELYWAVLNCAELYWAVLSDAEPWAKRRASASEGEHLMEVNENQLEIKCDIN